MMSSQILLNPIGSAGDVFPFLALGKELQRRGHHVAVMTNPLFKKNIGQAGQECIEIGTRKELRDVGADPRLHQQGQAWKLALKWGAVGTMRQSFEIIRDRSRHCDTVVVAPCLAFGARIAAEKLSVPLVTVVLSPFVIRSEFQCPVIKPMVLSDWVPRISKRLQFWIADRFVIDPVLGTEVASFRKEIGLEPQSRFLHRWCFSRDTILAMFSEEFATPQPDWPDNTEQVGHVSWDPPADTHSQGELERFLSNDRNAIVVLAGSAGPESAGFYQYWCDAAKQLDRQLILMEKNTSLIPSPLPEHVFHTEYMPVEIALKHATVIAHGGGVGTTLRSLAAGVPQIIIPRVNDQHDNASRVTKLGVGTTLAHRQLSVNHIKTAVQAMQSEIVQANCKRIGAQISKGDSIAKACDLIESTLTKHREN